ncbi:DUF218 domain-containing protein, partial [Metarhizium majus ARSEF 297]
MTDSAQIQRDAELIYNYHQMRMPINPADAIFCLCSLDTRVARRAAQLYLDGLAPMLIFSGASGELTAGRFAKTEAETFADVARAMGVPDDRMLVEPRATKDRGRDVRRRRSRHGRARRQGGRGAEGDQHGGECALHTRPAAGDGPPPRVAHPGAEAVHGAEDWPGETSFAVTSPQFTTFEEYPDEDNPRDLVISIMVGDLVRIRDYPALGFQVEQVIPDGVWAAMERLVRAGYDRHLPRGSVVNGSK